jgi:hypothetical protein
MRAMRGPIRGSRSDQSSRGLRSLESGSIDPRGVGEDRKIDTARTIEGGIGHDPHKAPGACADAILKAGRL